MADINDKLEKQMEGTNLALAAVAEVLQKMDGRLSKEAEEEEEEMKKSEYANAQAELVKSVASEVVSMLKANTEGSSLAGADVSGDERKAKGTGGTPQNADDSEGDAGIDSKIEDQQNTIQAAYNGDDDDEDDDIEKAYKKGYAAGIEKGNDDEEEEDGIDKEADDDDEAADEPTEEKGMDDDDDDDMEKMQKQLDSLKKQLAKTETNMQKAVTSEAESRLRKMGFREENGLQAPQMVNSLGVDDTTPIKKAVYADTPDQLAELSYSELRKLQHKIESGDTDGVPRELLG